MIELSDDTTVHRSALGVRLPKWVMGCLLSVILVPLPVAIFWWVRWPKSTGTEFVRLLMNDEFKTASAMLVEEEPIPELNGVFRDSKVRWHAATVQELIMGSRRFDVSFVLTGPDRDPFVGMLGFTVARGRISGGGLVTDSP